MTDQHKNLMDNKFVKPAVINGLWVIDRPVFEDERGFFHEVFRLDELETATGQKFIVRQWNHSLSRPGVLRGMHAEPWNKLSYCPRGEVVVVVVDIRPESNTFGQFEMFELGEKNRRALFICEGLAHGFYVKKGGLGDADYHYLVDKEYTSGPYQMLAWDDPDVGINWRTKNPELSEKDKHNPTLRELFPEKFK